MGLAGIVGAAAVAGAVVLRQRHQREWTEYEPDELRERLHARLQSSTPSSDS